MKSITRKKTINEHNTNEAPTVKWFIGNAKVS